jgi:hypothetical protein
MPFNMFRALLCPSSGALSDCRCSHWYPYECGGGRVSSRSLFVNNGNLKGLLMMGIIMPETCSTASTRQSNKFYDWLVHLVGRFIWMFWRCTEPQTLNSFEPVQKYFSCYRTTSPAPHVSHIPHCDNYTEQINLMTVYVMILFVAQCLIVVGIATGYGVDGPGIESWWMARFSAPVQTGPVAHPASCTMDTASLSGVKSGRGVMLTPHPLLVPWSWKSRAIPLLPPMGLRPVQSLSACTRVTFTFTFKPNDRVV